MSARTVFGVCEWTRLCCTCRRWRNRQDWLEDLEHDVQRSRPANLGALHRRDCTASTSLRRRRSECTTRLFCSSDDMSGDWTPKRGESSCFEASLRGRVRPLAWRHRGFDSDSVPPLWPLLADFGLIRGSLAKGQSRRGVCLGWDLARHRRALTSRHKGSPPSSRQRREPRAEAGAA